MRMKHAAVSIELFFLLQRKRKNCSNFKLPETSSMGWCYHHAYDLYHHSWFLRGLRTKPIEESPWHRGLRHSMDSIRIFWCFSYPVPYGFVSSMQIEIYPAVVEWC